MNLLEWHPFTYRQSLLPGKSDPELEVRAWLQCQFCGRAEEVKTTSTPIKTRRSDSYLGTPESRISKALEQLKVARSCRNCGMTSAMPEKDYNRLKQEVGRKITVRWILDQIAAELPPYTKISHDLKSVQQQMTEAVADIRIRSEQALKEEIDKIRQELEERYPVMESHQIKRSAVKKT